LVLLRKLVALAPDLVVFPDHLRSEFPGIFPDNLPFVCWAQDELSWLANVEAGRGVRQRDFVWVRDVDTYRDSYEYPQSQLVAATSWTVERPLEPRRAEPRHDLIYFSHSSWDRERIVSEPVAWGRVHGIDEGVLRTLSQELRRRYERDEAVIDLYRFCGEVAPTLGAVPASHRAWNGQRVVRAARPAAPQQLAVRALAQARSVLHRQQGLRWAARCARELGWSLSIYGRDWDKLPEFSEHARGIANYDTELIPLSQDSRVKLVLEPWGVVALWRGREAGAAGAAGVAGHER
jgi:hypothetical protein